MTRNIKRKITVLQHRNPKFDDNETQCKSNYPYTFQVKQAVNFTEVAVHQWLDISTVDSLIGRGIEVTISGLRGVNTR